MHYYKFIRKCMKQKRTRINQKEYDTIKQLLSLGLKVSQVVAVTKRSDSTIKSINRSTDMQNYRETIRNYVPKRDRIQSVEVQAERVITKDDFNKSDDWFDAMLEETRNTNKLLAELINSTRMNKKGWRW